MKKLFVVTACLLFAGSASAGNVYLGGSWGKATFTVEGENARAETEDSGYMLYAGYRVIRWFGVEVAYTDLLDGSETSMGVDFDLAINYWSAAAVGVLPVHRRLDLWAKLEATRWNTDVVLDDRVSPPIDESATGTGFGYGVGFDWYALRRFGIRGSWERFEFENINDVGYLSVGVIFRFKRE
jgi:OOP family OmpA-OmpF porin